MNVCAFSLLLKSRSAATFGSAERLLSFPKEGVFASSTAQSYKSAY